MKLTQDQITPSDSDTGGRTYTIDANGTFLIVPSVTTVMQIIEKPALVPWAFNLGVSETHSLLSEEPNLSLEVTKHRLKEESRTHEAAKDRGGDRGTVIHTALEQLINTGEYDAEAIEGYEGYIDSLIGWIEAYGPEWELSEFKVASVSHKYAGQFDATCTITKHPQRKRHTPLIGKRVLLDIKTNLEGRVYPRMHLPQIEAYGLAYNEMGGDDIDARVIVAIGPANNGKIKHQTCVSYAEPETFLSIRRAFAALKEMEANNPNKRK